MVFLVQTFFGSGSMSMDDEATEAFRQELLASVPAVRAFAISLCGNLVYAEDLAQETLVRAWANRSGYALGTNIDAWLFTILRNQFRSQYRKTRYEVEDANGQYTDNLVTPSNQEARIKLNELSRALAQLPQEQREALILVGASGFEYIEASKICECAIGTIKSRVNRARTMLAKTLSDDNAPA